MSATAATTADTLDPLAEVRAFILQNFYVPDPYSLADNASLLDHGIIDSTGVLEIIGFLESSFGIVVADRDIVPENMDSVAAIAAFVTRRRS